MINIENEIFHTLSTAIKASYPNAYITSKENNVPTSFPAISIVEIDNFTRTSTLNSSMGENHAHIVYEINIYSNKANTNKTETKNILSIVDTQMQELGFIRQLTRQMPTDETVYRIVARYKGLVSSDKLIFRG